VRRLLSITLVPVLMMLFIRGKIMPESQNPLQPFPDLELSPDHLCRHASQDTHYRRGAAGNGFDPLSRVRLGSEFMPTLNEGTLLYMPASLPGMSVTKAAELLQTQDKIIKSFPEVRIGVWQGGEGANRHRSGTAGDV